MKNPIYKLIAHPALEKQPRIPFYGYTVEDPEGNEITHIKKITFTIDPDKGVFGKLTIYREFLEPDDITVTSDLIEDVEAEIEIREPLCKEQL